METETVIKCMSILFCLVNCFMSTVTEVLPFLSKEFKQFLTERGIASSKSTPYDPIGNSQCERINQTVEDSTFVTLNLSTTGIYMEISTAQSLALGSILILHGNKIYAA